MSKKKSSGSVRQHPPRAGKRLGVKVFGGQKVKVGQIIVRQRGTKFHPGEGTALGRDFTLFAVKEGVVSFKKKMGKTYVVVN